MVGLNDFWGNNFSLFCNGHEIIWHSYYNTSSVSGPEFLFFFIYLLSFFSPFLLKVTSSKKLQLMLILCTVLSIHCHTCHVIPQSLSLFFEHILCLSFHNPTTSVTLDRQTIMRGERPNNQWDKPVLSKSLSSKMFLHLVMQIKLH